MKPFLYVLLIFSFILTPIHHPAANAQMALVADDVLASTAAQVRSFSCASIEDVPLLDCEALVALYTSTNGAGWTDNFNWLVSTTVADWYGVWVYNNRVVQIYLSANQLEGTLPEELGQLSQLTGLYLSENQISGSFPTTIGNLSNLLTLDLANNNLSGRFRIQLEDCLIY